MCMVINPILAPYVLKDRFAIFCNYAAVFSDKQTNTVKQVIIHTI